MLVLAVLTSLVGLLGAESAAPFDAGTIFNTLLGSSPVAGVLFWQLIVEQKDNKQLRQEVHDVNRRERETLERMAPLLVEASRALKDTSEVYEASDRRRRPDREQLADELRAVLREFQGRRGP